MQVPGKSRLPLLVHPGAAGFLCTRTCRVELNRDARERGWNLLLAFPPGLCSAMLTIVEVATAFFDTLPCKQFSRACICAFICVDMHMPLSSAHGPAAKFMTRSGRCERFHR